MGLTARRAVMLTMVLTLAGCTGSDPTPAVPGARPAVSPPAVSPPAASPPASSTAGGCGSTPLLRGGFPDWAASANAPAGLRYVRSHEANLVGVLFGDPLKVPTPPGGPNNKILWIVREPRNGEDLRLTLRPAGGGTATTVTEPANSSPGEIYPSIVDVPAPGCWTVVAEWGANRATLELAYQKG